jgi:hypothetical protein
VQKPKSAFIEDMASESDDGEGGASDDDDDDDDDGEDRNEYENDGFVVDDEDDEGNSDDDNGKQTRASLLGGCEYFHASEADTDMSASVRVSRDAQPATVGADARRRRS